MEDVKKILLVDDERDILDFLVKEKYNIQLEPGKTRVLTYPD